jgi:ABC-type glutathione transport system ATPase component
MSAPVMQVRLSADYGKRCVLKDVHFDLYAGEALGMVGTSGAGKTTLVMALLGLLPWRGGKASGEVLINGKQSADYAGARSASDSRENDCSCSTKSHDRAQCSRFLTIAF